MDTSELTTQPAASNRDLCFVGSAAGITAGVAMAMWAMLTSVWHGVGLLAPFEMMGATFTGANAAPVGFGSALYGILVHASTAACLGIVFTALLPRTATRGFAARAGLGYALAVLLAMTFVVIPVANPALRNGVDAIPKSWVIQHAIFGLMLGMVPAYWRWYKNENVRDRVVQASRRAMVVRRPQLPAAPPLSAFPRMTRARSTLRRSDIFGVPPNAVPRRSSQATS